MPRGLRVFLVLPAAMGDGSATSQELQVLPHGRTRFSCRKLKTGLNK